MDFTNIFIDAKSALFFLGVALALAEVLLGLVAIGIGILGFWGWQRMRKILKNAETEARKIAERRMDEYLGDANIDQKIDDRILRRVESLYSDTEPTTQVSLDKNAREEEE